MGRSSVGVMAITLAAIAGVGCQRAAPPAPARPVEASSLPLIAVKAKGSAKLLYTYAKPDGSFDTISEPDRIPADRRGWVRVVDLAIKPEKRLDHELVYVADLREARPDGTYPYVVLSREAFEAAASNRAREGATSPAPPPGSAQGGQVILYATTWCPACRSARDHMTQNNIPFVEKDIEKDPAAAAELLAKAKQAGISASGVPVLEVNGTLMQGFDPERLAALLRERPKK